MRQRGIARRVAVICALGASVVGATLSVTGCVDPSGTQKLPDGIQDPKTFNTPAGARAMYRAALQSFQFSSGSTQSESTRSYGAFLDAVLSSGLLTDELQAGDLGSSPVQTGTPAIFDIDARKLPDGYTEGDVTKRNSGQNPGIAYGELQRVRAQAAQAIGQLAKYDSSPVSRVLRGHLYALAGYAELLLADLYCSGVPLTVFEFEGDYSYRAGSTTVQVYQHASALFDTAITLSADSTRLLNFARLGKGRALLSISLDSLAAASQTVAPVPVDYRYEFSVDWTTVGGLGCSANVLYNRGGTVSDSEGHNGLPYRTDGLSDSRVATERLCDNLYARPQFVPLKYGGAQGGLTPITVASGVEGALIQAEASLKSGAGAEWLTILNQLRATVVTPALAPLDDPGTPETRLALLFKERAYWLFLTGHRQGDLRRLIRQYHHAPTAVFPTGQYPVGPGTPAQYSTDVTFPMPIAERNNPLFHGCLDRGA